MQWSQARKEFPSVRSSLAVVSNVTDMTSEHSSLSGLQTARRRNEGDESYKGTMKQGYTKNFSQAEIALEVDVTKQMRMFDKYDEIMKKMRAMGKSAERREELDIASLLSYAWSTSYTNLDGETVTTSTPDGVALISASHTPNASTATYSNQIGTTHDAISQTTLETLEELFNNFLDDDGRAFPCMPDTIITGRHAPTSNEVKRLMLSIQESGSANNDVNTHKGQYKHLQVPFIDITASTEVRDSDKYRYCFLAQLGDKDTNGIRMEVSQDVRFEEPEQVFETSTWQFGTTALYDFGTLTPNFIAGTKGDASAV